MGTMFTKPLLNAGAFSKPTITAEPRLLWLSLRRNNFPLENVTAFCRARYALAHAALLLKKRENNVVLLPSYHCPALVEPFVYAGYAIKYYPIRHDLTVDSSLFQKMLTPDISHVVTVRFFGFSGNIESINQLASESGKIIIEDCAHDLVSFVRSLYNPVNPVAARVSSFPKTLGAADGGVLFLAEKYRYKSKKPKFLEEIKSMCSGRRYFPVSPDSSYVYFSDEYLNYDCLRWSYLYFKYANYESISAFRNYNFNYLVKALSSSSQGKPLIAELSEGDTPYVFPFLAYDSQVMSRLRNEGIQALRWEELAVSECDSNRVFRERLVQLPIHQRMSERQLNKIVECLR